MANYTMPFSAIGASDMADSRRMIIDLRHIYQALRFFRAFDVSKSHLGTLIKDVELTKTSNAVQLRHGKLMCTLAGIHPGLAAIDFSEYGYALALARNISRQYDNMLFLTSDSNPVTGSLPQSHISAEEPEPWRKRFNEAARPASPNATHHLVDTAKMAFSQLYETEGQGKTSVDSKDLIYQCLFRLFALRPSEYLKNTDICIEMWAGLPYQEAFGEISFQQEILRDIYLEQRMCLEKLYYGPQAQLFHDLGTIFQGFGARGRLASERGEHYFVTPEGKRMKVYMKETGTQLASLIHGSFHYIHTPRSAGHTLGLYLEGSSMPFSVLAIEKTDRDYKRSALERYGIGYQHTYEITRMYSAPNTPRNTSSFFLAQASSYLKTADREWQASISSFMPSYATGASMLSGGFEEMLFVKPCYHLYEKTPYGYVARTKRTSRSTDDTRNQTQLMPVVELVHTRPKIAARIRHDAQLLSLRPEDSSCNDA